MCDWNRVARYTGYVSIIGGVGGAWFVVDALIVGEIKVASRFGGTSVYAVDIMPGPFYGFVVVCALCALFFIGLGMVLLRENKK